MTQPPTLAWTLSWLDSVKSGQRSMSQRKITAIENRGVGLIELRRLAKERGVHLVKLTDEHGNDLIAASMNPFKVIC